MHTLGELSRSEEIEKKAPEKYKSENLKEFIKAKKEGNQKVTGSFYAKQYAEAVSLMDTGTDTSIEQAKAKFEELSDYKDSKQLAKTCNDKSNEKASNFYNSALGSMEKAEYQKAYEKFGKYPDYLDSSDKMQECLKNLFYQLKYY